jgi:hypothetical protein
VAVHDAPPGVAVARYCVIATAEPSIGAFQVIVASFLPATAATPVGVPGLIAPVVVVTGDVVVVDAVGVTEFDALEGALDPAELMATTVKE